MGKVYGREESAESTVVDEHEEEVMPSTRETQAELLLSASKNTTESD